MNERMRQARKASGYTQAELARLLGYRSKSGYAMIEHGHNKPPLHTALRLAELLNVDVEFLFGKDNRMQSQNKGGCS